MTFYLPGGRGRTGTLAVLRSMGDARSTFVVNTVLGPLMLGGVVAGQLAGGAAGAAWGFAAATTLVVPLFWVRMEVDHPPAGRQPVQRSRTAAR